VVAYQVKPSDQRYQVERVLCRIGFSGKEYWNELRMIRSHCRSGQKKERVSPSSVDLQIKDLTVGKFRDRQITQQHSMKFGWNSADEASSEKGTFSASKTINIELSTFMPFLGFFSNTLAGG
jgi:hypothetical protein